MEQRLLAVDFPFAGTADEKIIALDGIFRWRILRGTASTAELLQALLRYLAVAVRIATELENPLESIGVGNLEIAVPKLILDLEPRAVEALVQLFTAEVKGPPVPGDAVHVFPLSSDSIRLGKSGFGNAIQTPTLDLLESE